MSSLYNISNVNSKHRHQNTRLVPLTAASGAFTRLRKQSTFCDATTGFPANWCPRNKPRKSILMTRLYRRHYSDLGSASGWLNILLASTNQKHYVMCRQYGISLLICQTSFHVETSRGVANVGWFHRLSINKLSVTNLTNNNWLLVNYYMVHTALKSP